MKAILLNSLNNYIKINTIPDLRKTRFICLYRKNCNYKKSNKYKAITEIGVFLKKIDFSEIKKKVPPKYQKCVSKQQVKFLWRTGYSKIPLLAGTLIQALIDAGLELENESNVILSIKSRLQEAMENDFAMNCREAQYLLADQFSYIHKKD